MLEIIKERTPINAVDYNREFSLIKDPEAGFSFPCDQQGNIKFASDAAKENYEYAIAHPDIYEDMGITQRKYTYTEDAIGRCSCKAEFPIYDQYLGACQCPKCGRWYNLFGQELLDPQYWEEDY